MRSIIPDIIEIQNIQKKKPADRFGANRNGTQVCNSTKNEIIRPALDNGRGTTSGEFESTE